jgi:hypothetical protein
MCFSANVSFGAAVILTGAGVASISQVRNIKTLAFACIPLVFATQQFCEGLEWKTFHDEGISQYSGIYGFIFLIFAQIVWPVWVPLSILIMEEKKDRRKILFFILITGLVTASYLGYCLFENSFIANKNSGHIYYDLACYHDRSSVSGLFYLIPTIVSPFISSVKKMKIIGINIFLSFLVSKMFFKDNVISVWCYFAAISSVFVFLIIRDLKEKEKEG